MPNPSALIWEGCDPSIAEAIRQLQSRWRPSSTGSSRHTLRLIEELVDPAIAACAERLPHQLIPFLPGVKKEWSFSNTIRKAGLNKMAVLQRLLLKQYWLMQGMQFPEHEKFLTTSETLIEFINACARKENRKHPEIKNRQKKRVKDTPLNNTRSQGFCHFCGAVAEFTDFAEITEKKKDKEVDIYPSPKKTLRLSSKYCLDHRPRMVNGKWNPAYQKAKRSEPEFLLELDRLYKQSTLLQAPCAGSGDPLVDSYIYHYVRLHAFRPGDEAEMRHHARLMVNARLSDRKKSIALLQQYGFSQSDIARKLGIPRQHVSRDLQAIPHIYRELPILSGFLTYLLQAN
jgi:hypothetical protein